MIVDHRLCDSSALANVWLEKQMAKTPVKIKVTLCKSILGYIENIKFKGYQKKNHH